MSDDLVKRLRGFATDGDGWKEVSSDARPDLHDAADRIEALERERDTEAGWVVTIREERDTAIRQRNAWQDRAEAAEAALAAMTSEENRLCADLKQAKDRADADRARLAKAVEALRMISKLRPETLAVDFARATLAEIGGK